MVFSGDKTFIDGRSELYEQAGVFDDYLHITPLKPGAIKVLGRLRDPSCALWTAMSRFRRC